jgi:hypothetical protein
VTRPNTLPTYLQLVTALLAAEELADLYQDLCQTHHVPLGDSSEESAYRVGLWDAVGAVINRIPDMDSSTNLNGHQSAIWQWQISRDNAGLLEITTPGLEGTATIAYLTGEDDPTIDEKLNTCRLVAAVNAFQGISTEVLIQSEAVMTP